MALTITHGRRPPPPGPAVVPRLALDAAEWAVLCERCEVMPPPGFGPAPDDPLDDDRRAAAAATLADKGVLLAVPPQAPGPSVGAKPGEETRANAVHRSVAANVATLVRPAVAVQVEASVGPHGVRALFGVAGPLGASLFALRAGGVELSMFAAVRLGEQLRRAVPPARAGGAAAFATKTTYSSGPVNAGPHGPLPVAALVEPGLAGPDGAAVAESVRARAFGALRCVVTGVGPAGTVLVGQVIWFATDTGWLGLRGVPDGSGRQLVELVPVAAEDLGVWVAPALARVLEARDG